MADLLALVGTVTFIETVKEVRKIISKKTRIKISQWDTDRKLSDLYNKINLVRKVKTIWQLDKPIDLSEFYCHPHVVIDNNRQKIQQLSDFGTSANLLIEGIAGQGKSIFLRYLCAVELAKGDCIPLFLELRRIDKSKSLQDRIYSEFRKLGLHVDDNLFDALADSGKVVLMLDAFDEIPDDLKLSVLTDIEDLASTHEKMRIIVTSRPNQNIQVSSYLSTVKLDNLQNNEYKQVIHRLGNCDEWSTSLIEHIEKRANHIMPLLSTPLMVTLLILLYKSYQHLPAKLSEFYDAIFEILLQRHDGTKPGFTRTKRCELDDTQYRSGFEALCICAKKSKQQTFTDSDLNKITSEALGLCDFNVKSDSYIKDIINITCLILKEGNEYRFIHKTMQEYYTATFISKKPEPWIKVFYHRILNGESYYEWIQELNFLSEIDTHRYNRFFLLPVYLRELGITENELSSKPENINPHKIKQRLADMSIGFSINQKQEISCFSLSEPGIRFWECNFSAMVLQAFSSLNKKCFTDIISKGSFKGRYSKMNSKEVEVYNIPVNNFLLHKVSGDVLLKITDDYISYMFDKSKKLHNLLSIEESPSMLDGLL